VLKPWKKYSEYRQKPVFGIFQLVEKVHQMLGFF